MDLLTAAVAAFLVCTTLLLVLRPVAVAVGLLDRPGGHKQHRGEIPVIGGIAIDCSGAVLALELGIGDQFTVQTPGGGGFGRARFPD